MPSSLLDGILKLLPSTTQKSAPSGFTRAETEQELFPETDPAVDGDECLHDCSSCSVRLPRKWSIDQDKKLYGHVSGWNTHLIVATERSDWVRDVTDEKGSVMEAVGRFWKDRPTKADDEKNDMMLSASNMPLPLSHADDGATTVLLLPAFRFIDGITPALVPDLLERCISQAPTNTSPLDTSSPLLLGRPCPHTHLILLCSQAKRDARCGQSAPLLRKEFERHLRPLGLARDLDDARPGGVAIYFISHVGGHKFSANCIIYRRNVVEQPDTDKVRSDEAAQCIWLARVRPEDCENIVRYTILQGKVVKPHTQLRGGFDRVRQLVSW